MSPWQQADSIARTLADTSSVRPDTLGTPPLPGGVAAIVRGIFGAPTWLWLTVIGIAAIAAGFLAWRAWTRRREIIG